MDFRGKPSRLFHNLPGPLEAVISNCDAWSGWDYLSSNSSKAEAGFRKPGV